MRHPLQNVRRPPRADGQPLRSGRELVRQLSADLSRPAVVAALVCLAILTLAALAFTKPSEHAAAAVATSVGASAPILGVNTDLMAYGDVELDERVDQLSRAGIHHVRQPVRWSAIEPQRGTYDWAGLDAVVATLERYGVSLLATIETAPAWARHDPAPAPDLWLCDEKPATDPRFADRAPPTEPGDLAGFAAKLAERYRGRLWAVEVWSEPNLLPNWRRAGPDPEDYARLLAPTAAALRAIAPGVLVLSAGLAPTTDVGVCYLSDVVFLDRLARTGALAGVDGVGIEPYGMRSGPGAVRPDREVLDFARAEVLHRVLASQGIDRPLWAVAWGWNTLPADWSGQSSPWGTHPPETAARWTSEAWARARSEWPWLGPMFIWHLQPDVPRDDPAWGFALLGFDGRPTALWQAAEDIAAGRATALPVPEMAETVPNGLLAVAAGLLLLGAALVVRPWLRGPLAHLLMQIEGLPPPTAGVAFVLALAVDVLAPWPASLVAVPAMVLIAAAHWRLGLAAVAAIVPFWYAIDLYVGPRAFGGLELVILIALAARAARVFVGWDGKQGWIEGSALNGNGGRDSNAVQDGNRAAGEKQDGGGGIGRLRSALVRIGRLRSALVRIGRLRSALVRIRRLPARWLAGWTLLDWLVLALVVWAGLSPLWAEHRAPALREWRTVILEPALIYALLRTAPDRRAGARAALDGLVLGGVLVALWGLTELASYLAGNPTAGVLAEGVIRIKGPYASPNNLALLLGRLVPVVAAVGLWSQDPKRRWAHRLAAVPILVALFATFSRGALLVGLPLIALYLGLVAQRGLGAAALQRALAVATVSTALIALLLLPFAGTQRVAGVIDPRPGSTLHIRWRLWQSAAAMAGDHAVRGVGLDNFLYLYRDRYVQRDAVQERFLSHPHNFVLDWWTRLGLVGLLIFLGLVAGNVRAGRLALRTPPAWSALAVAGLGLQVYALAHGLVDNVFFLVDLAVIWWIGQAVLLALGDSDGA